MTPTFTPSCPLCRVIYFRGGYSVRLCKACESEALADAQASISLPSRFVDDVLLTNTKKIDA